MAFPASFYLQEIITGQRYPISAAGLTIGRSRTNNVVILDNRVSRSHAMILLAGGRVWIRDVGSKAGTFVNNTPVYGQQEIFPGDSIQIGPFMFQIRSSTSGNRQSGLSSERFRRTRLIYVVIIAAFVLVFILAISGGSGGGQPITSREETPFVLSPTRFEDGDNYVVVTRNTKIISDGLLAGITQASPDGSTINFTASNPQAKLLQNNDILVSGANEKFPQGILRKVVRVTAQGGEILIETTPAYLEEAIIECNLHFTFPLEGIQTAQHSPNYRRLLLGGAGILAPLTIPAFNPDPRHNITVDFPRTYLSNSVYVDGAMSFNPQVVVDIKMSGNNLDFFLFEIIGDETIELGISGAPYTISLGGEVPLKKFIDIKLIPVGGFPVVLTIETALNLGGSGNADGTLNPHFTQNARIEFGTKFEAGQFMPLASYSPSFAASLNPTLAPSSLTLYLEIQPAIKVYGILGPFISAGIFGEFESAANRNPCWEIFGGINADAGLEFGFPLFKKLEDVTQFSLPLKKERVSIINSGGVCSYYQTPTATAPIWLLSTSTPTSTITPTVTQVLPTTPALCWWEQEIVGKWIITDPPSDAGRHMIFKPDSTVRNELYPGDWLNGVYKCRKDGDMRIDWSDGGLSIVHIVELSGNRMTLNFITSGKTKIFKRQ